VKNATKIIIFSLQNQQLSPRSTPSSSSTPSRGKSPSVEPESQPAIVANTIAENNVGAALNSSAGFDWRQNLLSAADSVTSAMSSLVLEYNGGKDEYFMHFSMTRISIYQMNF